MIKKWKLLGSTYVLDTKWLKVRRDHVRMPSGFEMDDFYILEYPDWVNIIAITEHNEFIVEYQYRHGLNRVELELCAGCVDCGEDPLDAAKRELLEETGYGSGNRSLYMVSAPNHAAMTNYNYTFIARDVKKIQAPQLERSEDIEIRLVSRNELLEFLRQDSIIEGVQSAPLWRYFYENK